MSYRCLRTGLPLALILAFAAAAAAEDFPPVTAEERSLTAVAGEPNAPAVVLFRDGVFRMMGSLGNEASSLLTVRVRIKILTEAGKERGDVQIAHSNRVRLQSFAGRTTLPDGTVVPLPKEVTYKRTASRSRRIYVTSVAFPAVQVGAILDYRYEMRWDSPFYFDPWVFQDRLPVLHSEIVYEVPSSLQASSWRSNPMRVDIKSEATKTVTGTRVRIWADQLPAVPEEVHGLPFADMTARQILLPGRVSSGGHQERLFDSWPSTCYLFYLDYETARHRSGAAERKARALTARASPAAAAATPAAPAPAVRQASIAAVAPAAEAARPPSPQRRQAAAIFEFVRDEIATAEGDYVWLPEYSNVDAVLGSRRGTTSEKALLLQAMLDAVGIKSRLVWAVDRESGAIDVALPNPAWFDRVLVAADIDGSRVFLDPSDRALAFGHLDPGYEGTNALLYDHKKPEMIVLPESRSSDNLQHARLDLALDADGRASGRGTLELLGHDAFRRTRWQGDAGSATEAWSKWLRERRQHFDTVDIAGGEILHSSDKLRVVRFPPAPPGAMLGLDYESTDHPYFPAGRVSLGGHGAAISQLTVRVRHPGGGAGRAAAAGWRWTIQGPTEGLHVSETPGELLITATGLPRPPQLEHVPTEVREGPVLHYGWGEAASWEAVGRWYDELARAVPRQRAEVRQAARQLLAAPAGTLVAAAAAPEPAAAAARRARLERILDFVRREVRYVAVEVGVGGFRPAPPHETLARRWGDCKAKVTLLLDMLEEAGIEAYPALVLADRDGRIDPRFPAPGWFNHMIAALPVDGLAVGADDPVAGGYLFVDPTQERGGAGWLHPADQDQMALVLRGDRTVLVATPLRPRLEAFHLTVDLEVRPDGSAAGRLRLELRGGAAAAEAEELAGERPEHTATRTHLLITAWLPGAGVSGVHWTSLRAGGVPEVTLTAAVTLPSLVAPGEALPAVDAGGGAAGGGSRWLALAGPKITPAPGLLRDRSAPVVVRPGVEQVTWHLTLPDGWCAAPDAGADLDNAAGAFHQSISCAGRLLTVERRGELRLRWIEPAQFPAVAAVSLAEHRAAARRLRLDRR